jgi:hypothetical protein
LGGFSLGGEREHARATRVRPLRGLVVRVVLGFWLGGVWCGRVGVVN